MPIVFSEYDVNFRTEAVPAGSLSLLRLTGTESLSHLYEFSLVVRASEEGGSPSKRSTRSSPSPARSPSASATSTPSTAPAPRSRCSRTPRRRGCSTR